MRSTYFLFGSLFLFFSAVAQTRIAKVNEKYTLVRPCYPNMVSAPIYDNIYQIIPGYFLAEVKGKYGILDSLGKEKVSCTTYTYHQLMADGITNENYHYFAKGDNGILTDDKGTTVANFSLAIAAKWGNLLLVNVRKDEFDQMEKTGIMDLKGNWLIKPDRKSYNLINQHCIQAIDTDERPQTFMLLNTKLEPIVNEKMLYLKQSKELIDSIMLLKQIAVFGKEFYWVVDSNGKVSSKQPRWDDPEIFKDKSTLKYGFKLNEKTIVPAQYDNADMSEEYLLGFNTTKGTTDFYDLKGNLLETKNYKNVFTTNYNREPYPYEYLVAEGKGGLFLLNEKFDPASIGVQKFDTRKFYDKDSIMLFACEIKGKYGVLNQKGKVIIPFTHSSKPDIENGFIRVWADETTHNYYTIDGTLIVKNAYSVSPLDNDPSRYIIETREGVNLYSINPLKALLTLQKGGGLYELRHHKLLHYINHGYDFLFNLKLEALNKKSFRAVETEHMDSNTVLVMHDDIYKWQFLNTKLEPISEQYDKLKLIDKTDGKEIYRVANDISTGRDEKLKYGLVDARGKILIRTEWDTVILMGKLASVQLGKDIFITDTNFVVNKNQKADSVDRKWKDYGTVYLTKGKWRFAEYPKTEIEFDEIKDIGPYGKMQVKQNGKWGIYDLRQQKWSVRPRFDSAVNVLNYHSGRFVYTTKIDKWYYFVDSVKSLLYGSGYTSIDLMYWYYDGLHGQKPDLLVNLGGSKAQSRTDNFLGGKFGIVDAKGKELCALRADHAIPLTTVCNDEPQVIGVLWNIGGISKEYIGYGRDSLETVVVNEYGNEVYKKYLSPPEYSRVILGGKFGIMSPNGKEILPAVYDDIEFYNYHGESGVRRCSYSDSVMGRNIIIPQIYPVFVKKDAKWGMANLTGKILFPPMYDEIKDGWLSGQRGVQVFLNGKYGYLDLYGKEITPVEFSAEEYFNISNTSEDEVMLFQKGGSVSSYTLIGPSAQVMNYDSNTGEETVSTFSAIVTQNNFSGGKYGLYDLKKEKWILDPIYEDLRFDHSFHPPDSLAIRLRTSVIGKYTLPCDHAIASDSYYEIKKDGKWGIFYFGKGIILKPEFDEIIIEENGFKTKTAGVEKLFTLEGNPK